MDHITRLIASHTVRALLGAHDETIFAALLVYYHASGHVSLILSVLCFPVYAGSSKYVEVFEDETE